MRILVTSIVDLQKSAPQRLHWFLKYLGKSHEITVLSINDWWKARYASTNLYSRGFDIGDINVIHLTERRASPIIQEATSAFIIDKLLKRLDYRKFNVHFNYNTLVSGYCVSKRLISSGINTVYDIADDLPKMIGSSKQIPPPLRPLGRSFGRTMLNKNLKIASKVSFVTATLKNLYPAPENKATIIPNGVDIELFQPRPSPSLRQELGLDGSFVIGFVGTLREWVDFDPIFGALKQLDGLEPPVSMLIVGDEGGMAKAKELAKTFGVEGKVKFTGTVPLMQVPDYTCCMDACVMPLKFDNAQPLTLLQYLACGKPVIATRPLEVPSGFILYAADKQQVARQIMELVRNPELRQDLGVKGRQYVEQNHNWMKIAANLEMLLQDAAEGRSVS
jgi:glycosyltransferase involved in cell wall biosynthesis